MPDFSEPTKADAELRLRTYWYVVDEIDFWPYGIQKLLNSQEFRVLETVLRKFRSNATQLDAIADPVQRQQRLVALAKTIIARERSMKSRFEGWQVFQNGIAHRFDSVEFRRAGSIRYDLFTQRFGKEKGVDVKLATDVLKLNDIFDVGIIVSGDGDYVPAVQAVKDWGKHMVNVSFLKKNGGVLPGGARRLNQCTDCVIELEYEEVRNFMKIVPKAKPLAPLPPPVVQS
ncbi:MAG: NYN domain-containing protein [Candidatus Acidiferrum sp.]